MNLKQYLGKNIRVTYVDGHVWEGYCHTFTGKLDTEDELYDEITIETDKHPYVGFNESEIKCIEVIQNFKVIFVIWNFETKNFLQKSLIIGV